MIAILLLLPLHCIVVFQHHSSSGALSASTQKPPQGGILPMILMSVPSNSKSKTFAFSIIRSSLEDLGSGTMFFCNSQRRHTWAVLLPYFAAISYNCWLFRTRPFPNGPHASKTILCFWQNSTVGLPKFSVFPNAMYRIEEINLMPNMTSTTLKTNGKVLFDDYLMKIGLNVFGFTQTQSHVISITAQ